MPTAFLSKLSMTPERVFPHFSEVLFLPSFEDLLQVQNFSHPIVVLFNNHAYLAVSQVCVRYDGEEWISNSQSFTSPLIDHFRGLFSSLTEVYYA